MPTDALELSPAEILLIEWRHLYDSVHDIWETFPDGVEELVSRVFQQQKTSRKTPEEISQAATTAVNASGVKKLSPISFTDFIMMASFLDLGVPYEVWSSVYVHFARRLFCGNPNPNPNPISPVLPPLWRTLHPYSLTYRLLNVSPQVLQEVRELEELERNQADGDMDDFILSTKLSLDPQAPSIQKHRRRLGLGDREQDFGLLSETMEPVDEAGEEVSLSWHTRLPHCAFHHVNRFVN